MAHGIIAALLTPTDNSGKLMEDAARCLVRHVRDGGVHGLFPVGTAGEFYALDYATKVRMTEITLEESQGLPVYMGTAASTTKECVDLATAARDIGVHGVTVLTPVFPRCSEEELYHHYKAIAGCGIGVMLYTNPGNTGTGLSPGLVARLAAIENIVGIKDSSGDLTLMSEYVLQSPKGFEVLMGRDSLIFGALVYGAVGAVAATANVAPRLAADIYRLFKAGDMDGARQAQLKLVPLRRAFALGTTSAGVLKEAMRAIGMDCGEPILPARGLDDRGKSEIRKVLEDMKAI